MANQHHPDKTMVGWRIFKWDKADLKNNAKTHGVHMSDIFKASVAHYLNLNNSQQRKILNAGDWE
jgi:uncharacterized DUF497 family protein